MTRRSEARRVIRLKPPKTLLQYLDHINLLPSSAGLFGPDTEIARTI